MIFPQDPKIDIGTDGFAGKDLLGRREFGQRLTDLVDKIEQPLVIALDAEWGSGKSHFLKLWAGAHKHDLDGKAEVIYFDAFEHDFLDDPLVSLIGRLADDPTLAAQNPAKLKTLKKVAMPLARIVIKAGFALATFGATNYLGDALDKVAEAVGDSAADSAEKASDKFWEKESGRLAAMREFRKGLEALTIKEDGTTQKIVFIIDELDRCRPDYALNLLEIIKHFFAVPNVHFVLGVNLHALEHSVRARYGHGIDAAKYLQKFVMLTMTLPRAEDSRPEVSIARKYYEAVAAQFIPSANLKDLMDEYLAPLFASATLSIRDIQRILSVAALFSDFQEKLSFGYRSLLVGAGLLKVLSSSAFNQLRNHSLTLDDLAGALKLEPRKQVARGNTTDRIWIIWAIILSPDRLESEGIPKEETKRYVKSFDQWGDEFNWRVGDTCLTRAFDIFTLPDTP
jgi:hypothetical protein